MKRSLFHASAKLFIPARIFGAAVLLFFLTSPAIETRAQARGFEARGRQFIGFKSFSHFEKTRGSRPLETVLTSPVIVAQIPWDELIASWNAEMPEDTYLKVQARAIYLTGSTPYYTMALWSSDPRRHPRESVPNQNDDQGRVATDTLLLRRPAERLQIRLLMGSGDLRKVDLKFVGISLADSHASPAPLPPNTACWGKLMPVPERSQMPYPNGKVLCSPTTVSMLMAWWAQQLKRPELDRPVPEIAAAIYDTEWQGTGNWPFNTAYAGSFRGIRAYVSRMSDLSELEDWIAAGIPVGLSLDYDRLRGKGPGPNGHLVVCVGFAPSGDPVINDPGTSTDVRKIFPRKNLAYAWAASRNTAYLIYPANSEIPKDRFGHWDSWTARQRARFE